MSPTFSGDPIAAANVQGRLFSDVLLTVAKECLVVREGTASASSSVKTQLTDAAYDLKDMMAGGTIWFLSGSNLGLTRKIKGIKPGGIFTFDQVTANPSSGDSYAVAEGDIPRHALISAVNEALRRIGWVVEDTTLATVACQYSYDLPTDPLAVTDLTEVWIGKSATEPIAYYENRHWDEQEGELIFDPGFEPQLTGMPIKLRYKAAFSPFSDLDAIPLTVNDDKLHWQAVLNAAKYGKKMHGKDKDHDWTEKQQEAEARIQRAGSQEPPLQRKPKLANW